MNSWLWSFACVAVGWLLGWLHAHVTVAAECERLGGFYVGTKIYKCTAVTDNDKTNHRSA